MILQLLNNASADFLLAVGLVWLLCGLGVAMIVAGLLGQKRHLDD